MNIRERVCNYLKSHPIDRTEKDPYGRVAKRFDVSTEVVRCQWRKLRRKGNVKEPSKLFVSYKVSDNQSFKKKGNEAVLSKATTSEIKNEKQLAKECDIDLNKWVIKEWECKRYNAWIKNQDGEIESQPKYSVWVRLKEREIKQDLELQKEVFLKELKAHAPSVKKIQYKNQGCTSLLELCTFDLHLGSLSWGEETGENYDIKIAENRFKDAISDLLSRVDLSKVERILFPIGNDMLNVDNKNNTTTNGTVVDTDVRFIKMVRTARRILIETIDQLSEIAPVDVVVVPGNHDFTTIFMLADLLDAYYHNNPNVTINNTPKSRKVYQYGKVALFFTHGDEEKHNDLPIIFATEYPEIWASTQYRFIQVGHHHKNKKSNYVSVDEFPGIQVQILPTLSSRTHWAYKKGYSSLKQAKAFLYCKKRGLLGEYTHTV